jgi:acyl-coenzyme A synthetase/AMP-(fatty) acid ligase
MNGITMTGEGGISPGYGRRLINVELDRIANTDPGRPFLARPRNPTDLSAGFEDISYHRISNAVNRTAHWLQKALGKPRDFDTIAYLAPPDVRNILLTFAVGKVGFKVSFTVFKRHRLGRFLHAASCCFCLPATAYKATSIFSI